MPVEAAMTLVAGRDLKNGINMKPFKCFNHLLADFIGHNGGSETLDAYLKGITMRIGPETCFIVNVEARFV